jgi:predicted lipoprotein with Yx(FWY)xxD motif
MVVYGKNHRTTEGRSMKRLLIFVGAAVAIALTVAACGSRASATGATTVATKQIGGTGTVLVNTAGLPLYTNNQDTAAMAQCNGACATVWPPLTIAAGSPSGTSAAGSLGVIALSNGTRQVTVNGKPVYTFSFDKAGKVTGNDAKDQFGAQKFTWRVVTTSGTAASSGSGQGGSSSGSRY